MRPNLALWWYAYASNITYAAIRLGTSQAGSDVWWAHNDYGTTANNGNLRSHKITIGSNVWTQYFQYDAANRVSLAVEQPNNSSSPVCPDASSQWCESFSYDIFGNRLISQRTNVGVSPLEASSYTTATNHIAGSGWSYDARGNITGDPFGDAFTYDVEGRQITYVNGSQNAAYTYDGDGNRVKKVESPGTGNARTTLYIYDAAGHLAQEYVTGLPLGSAAGRQYTTQDHLGSTRVLTGATGSTPEFHDYRPFGDEIASTAGSLRAGIAGYASDSGDPMKFTSKERDAETGLDYFGERYFSSAQGRFTSADPKRFSSRTLVNPQKWNKYAYTLNNPLALVDPDGKEEVTIQFRAFIPPSSIAGFRGDNRSFSADPNASSRVSTTARIETDPAKNGGNPLLGFSTVVGGTQPMIGVDPRVSDGPIQPVVTATQDKDGNVTLNIQESMGNPFTHLVDSSGTIKSNMNIVVNESATNAQFKGTVSGSPAFESNISVNGGTNQNVPLQAAPTNTLQFVLGLHSTDQINKTVPLKKDPSQQ